MNQFIHEQMEFKIKTWLRTNISSSVGNGTNFVILKVYDLGSTNRCIQIGAKAI